MDRKSLHEKISSILSKTTLDNMLESFNTIEFHLVQNNTKTNTIFIPQEANFQLPNQFLGIKPNAQVDKILSSPPLNIDNNKINQFIELLDELNIEKSTSDASDGVVNPQLENLVRKRFFG